MAKFMKSRIKTAARGWRQKVVPTTSTGFASELKNYNWIIKNRDKLPDDIKQHLVEVYELIETPDRKYLLILMEQLEPARRDVIDQIFAHDKESKYSEEKEDRIFRDSEATYEIINKVLKANNMLRNMRNYRGLSNTDRTRAANSILGVFLSDQEVPESSIEQVYTMLENYEISTPQWQRLFNAILNETEKLLHSKDKDPQVDRAILWAAATSIDDALQYNVSKQIIPVKYGAGYVDPQAGAGPEIAAVFPEIEGILKTIKYFAEHGWRARDLHAGNVMTRSDTNQLVIVDVGLFCGGERFSMKKTLKNNDYVLTLLTAHIKKNGGQVTLTEEELHAVEKTDLIGMFYDTKKEVLVLRIMDPAEVMRPRSTSKNNRIRKLT